MANSLVVAEGYVTAAARSPDLLYAGQLRELGEEARKKWLGLLGVGS